MSPRERTYAPRSFVGAAPADDRSAGGMAKALGLFVLVALPIGLAISASQDRKQTEVEKAAFRRAGLDWDKRFQYPK